MKSLFETNLLEQIESSSIVAVLVLDEVRHAVPLARALLAGGVTVMELTLRTPAAIEGLREIRTNVPEMLAGIGTILTTYQLAQVVSADASFGVSPGTNPRVVEEARKLGLPFAPGVVTPSDVESAIELGCREPQILSCGTKRRFVLPKEYGGSLSAFGHSIRATGRYQLRESCQLSSGSSDLGSRRILDRTTRSYCGRRLGVYCRERFRGNRDRASS